MIDRHPDRASTPDETPVEPDRLGTVLPEPSPFDAPLPRDLRVALGRFLGIDHVDTLRDWARALPERMGVDGLSVGALCFTPYKTPHQGVLDGETYSFACFYDAVLLAALTDRSVRIRTESPAGVEITAHATGEGDVEVDPPDALFSFGIDRHVPPPDAHGPSTRVGYASICPFVNAFPSEEAYRTWAGTAPAPTVALRLRDASRLATLLTGDSDG